MASEYQTELLKDYDNRNSLTTSDIEAPTVKEFGLDSETSSAYQQSPPSRRRHNTTQTIISTLKSLFFLTFLTILILILRETHTLVSRLPLNTNHHETPPQNNQSPPPDKHLSKWYCGNNPTTARANNCVFDVMLTTWLHADCAYPSLMESYLSTYAFNWSRNVQFTDPVPLSEMRLGNHKHIYVDPEFHYIHCAYTWDMQLLAFHQQRPLVESLADPEHGRHCSKLLMDHVLPRNETSLTVVGEVCVMPEGGVKMPALEGGVYKRGR